MNGLFVSTESFATRPLASSELSPMERLIAGLGTHCTLGSISPHLDKVLDTTSALASVEMGPSMERSTTCDTRTQTLHDRMLELQANDQVPSLEAPKSTMKQRRKSRTHSELAATTVGLRAIAKKLGKTPLTWASKPKTVLIVTKLNDDELVFLTRKVARWLLSKGLNVLVQDSLLDHPAYQEEEEEASMAEDGQVEKEDRLPKHHQESTLDQESWPSPSSVTTDTLSHTSSDISQESFEPNLATLTFWNEAYCATKEAKESVDFIITLGGDGTVLFAAWLFQQNSDLDMPPILPFNLGSLGFLTVFDFEAFQETMNSVLSDHFDIRMNMRMRFACIIHRHDSTEPEHLNTYHILNDVVVDRGPSPFVSQLELYANQQHLTTVQADGLVVSTPTGSTAYSLSAGGSLVHPDVSAILVTPICPHTLSFRPMLLPDTMELVIQVPFSSRATACVSFDGRHRVQLQRGDKIIINASHSPIPTVCLSDSSSDWFHSLERCLSWNKRQRQKSMVNQLLKNW